MSAPTSQPGPGSTARAGWRVRDLEPDDAPSWARCRVLSFLASDYYDDVHTEPPTLDRAIRLVAVRAKPADVLTPGAEEVVGILDIELFDADDDHEQPFATIDTVAVHPDHLRRGIADALLGEGLRRLAGTDAVLLDAWTREDEAANRWYQNAGFHERFAYVHVHKDWDDPHDGFASPDQLSRPVKVFAHGRLEDLAVLRERYRRVYICRRYVRPLRDTGAAGAESVTDT